MQDYTECVICMNNKRKKKVNNMGNIMMKIQCLNNNQKSITCLSQIGYSMFVHIYYCCSLLSGKRLSHMHADLNF